MDTHALRDYALTVSEVGAALACLWGALRYFWPCSKRCVFTITCAWNRVRVVWAALEYLPLMQGQMHELRAAGNSTSAMVTRINEAVILDRPDSLPSRLNLLSEQSVQRSFELAQHGEHLINVSKKVDAIANTMRATNNTNTRLATFETDAQGRCVYVNRTYLRWVGLTFEEVHYWGWLNAVHPDDRQRVYRAWKDAVADSRRFQDQYRLVHSDGTVFLVDGNAEPIPEGGYPAERWVGSLIKVESPE